MGQASSSPVFSPSSSHLNRIYGGLFPYTLALVPRGPSLGGGAVPPFVLVSPSTSLSLPAVPLATRLVALAPLALVALGTSTLFISPLPFCFPVPIVASAFPPGVAPHSPSPLPNSRSSWKKEALVEKTMPPSNPGRPAVLVGSLACCRILVRSQFQRSSLT